VHFPINEGNNMLRQSLLMNTNERIVILLTVVKSAKSSNMILSSFHQKGGILMSRGLTFSNL